MDEQTTPRRKPAKPGAAPTRKRTTPAAATARTAVAATTPAAKPTKRAGQPTADTAKPKAPRVRASRATPEPVSPDPVPARPKPKLKPKPTPTADHGLTQLEIAFGDLPDAPAPAPVAPPGAEQIGRWGQAKRATIDAGQRFAREAVSQFGPEARDWVARTRHRYPTAEPAALARLATVESIQGARRRGAQSGVLGVVAGIRLIGADEARLVLAIAAAYGVDPTEPARATELVSLLRVPDPDHRLGLVQEAGRSIAGFAARHVAARVVPFGAALARSVQNGRRMEALAARADAHYRKRGQSQETLPASQV